MPCPPPTHFAMLVLSSSMTALILRAHCRLSLPREFGKFSVWSQSCGAGRGTGPGSNPNPVPTVPQHLAQMLTVHDEGPFGEGPRQTFSCSP